MLVENQLKQKSYVISIFYLLYKHTENFIPISHFNSLFPNHLLGGVEVFLTMEKIEYRTPI